jgi:signal transduction histidine kinase/DNA-binding NarL/FixJ family response regulator
VEALYHLIETHEEWLMARILQYAIQQDYAQFTSTLKEPWRLSICGLSEPLLASIRAQRYQLELTPTEDYTQDPIATFGILEAQRHRQRGISLNMFLGLFKYYRQSYQDLLDLAQADPEKKRHYRHFINRFFDRVELGYCSEWASGSHSLHLQEMQATNRYLTNEKNKYLTIFESLASPVILLNSQHHIHNINLAAVNLLNAHADSNRYYSIAPNSPPTAALPTKQDWAAPLIGLPASQLMPWIARELDHFEHLSQTQTQPYLETGRTIRTREGLRHYLVKLSPMMDISGKFTGILLIFDDHTVQKLAEMRVRKARDTAEAANRAKSEFLANMSHELRTPLNVILGFSQLMELDPKLPDRYREDLAVINRSGEHLLTLINQVLDLSKIESGQMTLNEHTFDLVALLNHVIDLFHLRAADKGLQLTFKQGDTLPHYVYGDEVKLRQVLINLLNNALKFTQKGSVTLFVDALGPIDDTDVVQPLHFEVSDTGVGMTPTEMAHIFESFVQAKAGRDAQEGSGLGMAISQKFVRLMGGQISVHSTPGQGSTFTFEVGFKVGDARLVRVEKNAPHVVALANPSQRHRILVVDDKIDNRLLLINLLAPLGFELREAINGREAIEICTLWEPHLIWMDIRMPEMDGLAATLHLKGTPAGQNAVIVALTASLDQDQRQAVLNVGCDDFLRKPFRQNEVFDIMNKHLGVEFIYEDSPWLKPTTEQSPLTSTALNALPPTWLQAFQDVVEQVDRTAAQSLVQDLLPMHPQLAAALNEALSQFRFDKLQTLMEELNP